MSITPAARKAQRCRCQTPKPKPHDGWLDAARRFRWLRRRRFWSTVAPPTTRGAWRSPCWARRTWTDLRNHFRPVGRRRQVVGFFSFFHSFHIFPYLSISCYISVSFFRYLSIFDSGSIPTLRFFGEEDQPLDATMDTVSTMHSSRESPAQSPKLDSSMGRVSNMLEHGSMFPACRGQPMLQTSRS